MMSPGDSGGGWSAAGGGPVGGGAAHGGHASASVADGGPAGAGAALTALVTALPEEAEEILLRLEDPRSLVPPSGATGRARGGLYPRGPGLRCLSDGRLAGVPVVVGVTGDGELNARAGISALLAETSPSRLVALGVAGGLAPELRPGSLVVGRRVLRQGGAPLAAPESLAELASRATGAAVGVVVTAGRLLDTPASKAAFRERWAANGGLPAVVDLESAFYAAAAEEAGIPWVVMRCVSDAAFEELPGFLNRCRDAGGGVRRAAVLRRALARPGAIPSLLRMHRRVRRGGTLLADAVERLLARWDLPDGRRGGGA